MLSHIHIRDFAIIDRLELELEGGMTVLTGETGAGKSILVDALALALGDRADSETIRHGADKAEISATFETAQIPAAARWLAENDLDMDGECQIRRILNREGRSKGYINGSPAPMASLKALGDLLLDIHGQHEHQSLMRREAQREVLDDYGRQAKNLEQVAKCHRDWHAAREELERLQRESDERGERLELLRYQVEELDQLALADGELERLDEEHGRLANAGRLLESGQRALAMLDADEESAAATLIAHAQHDLESLRELDGGLAAACELVEGALIQLREGAGELRGYLERLELDPQRLNWVEERIGVIHDLARKHRVEPAGLAELFEHLQQELSGLENADQRLGGLDEEVARLAESYRAAAAKLTKARRKAGDQLAKKVSAAMQELGMKGGRLEVSLEPLEGDAFSPLGLERVEFLVSANPGQPLKSLGKVASGGELSRISLAIQVIIAHTARIPTLIFDEVDTGVGGGVAEIVGRTLRTLGESRQVLCVTHLPQVAAQGHHHLQVSKVRGKSNTQTGIRVLEDKDRVEEVARMLGGVKITEQTLAHAEEMIGSAG